MNIDKIHIFTRLLDLFLFYGLEKHSMWLSRLIITIWHTDSQQMRNSASHSAIFA